MENARQQALLDLSLGTVGNNRTLIACIMSNTLTTLHICVVSVVENWRQVRSIVVRETPWGCANTVEV